MVVFNYVLRHQECHKYYPTYARIMNYLDDYYFSVLLEDFEEVLFR